MRSRLEHDPEKPAPDVIRGGNRFSNKIMLNRKDRLGFDSTWSNQALMFAALKRYG
jgi:hypothetical protein